jgi:hypothetical protein
MNVIQPKRNRGQPRKHTNNAVKQAAYRLRKQERERRALVERVLWKTPLRTGETLIEAERKLQGLTIRKLKERLGGIS